MCGVSEMGYFLVSALEARGHTFEIFANKFAGEYYPVPDHVRNDGPNVQRIFGTGFHPDQASRNEFDDQAVRLALKGAEVLIVNYQDYVVCNKAALNAVVEYAHYLKLRVIFCFHDDCVSDTLCLRPDDIRVVPPSLAPFFPGTVIDQGYPEFRLKGAPASENDANWCIACFGMGRNKTQALMDVVQDINSRHLLDKPLWVHLSVGKPNQFADFEDAADLIIRRGYTSPETLAERIHACHACVIWYPEIQGHSTSSAFRFAVGAKVPIIANRTNWVADQRGNGCWIEVPDEGAAGWFQYAILRLFLPGRYATVRARLEAAQTRKIQESGWSRIAESYEQLFR